MNATKLDEVAFMDYYVKNLKAHYCSTVDPVEWTAII